MIDPLAVLYLVVIAAVLPFELMLACVMCIFLVTLGRSWRWRPGYDPDEGYATALRTVALRRR
jgi:hypothetical protein